MGRTNPTFRDRLERVRAEWGDYRRALRRRDEPHFDRLFEHARAHADACGYLNHDAPVIAVLLSVALEQEAAIADLQDRVATLEAAHEDDTGRAVADSQTEIERTWSAADE
jgi:pantoate kinase